MSKAGIQSNRGDGYQTLVALDWALTVLSDPEYQWLEVDSVMWSVDDVVIGKADGRKICCQCKKNQTAFKAWSIADLSDELHKANSLLANDSTALVSCRIPDDCIDKNRYPLFMARSVLRELIESLPSTRSL